MDELHFERDELVRCLFGAAAPECEYPTGEVARESGITESRLPVDEMGLRGPPAPENEDEPPCSSLLPSSRLSQCELSNVSIRCRRGVGATMFKGWSWAAAGGGGVVEGVVCCCIPNTVSKVVI